MNIFAKVIKSQIDHLIKNKLCAKLISWCDLEYLGWFLGKFSKYPEFLFASFPVHSYLCHPLIPTHHLPVSSFLSLNFHCTPHCKSDLAPSAFRLTYAFTYHLLSICYFCKVYQALTHIFNHCNNDGYSIHFTDEEDKTQ